MAMVTSGRISLLKNIKPFKTTWIVEVKVLHSWSQPSNYAGGDSLQFILADRPGVKIYCTCKRVFFPRVKKLQVGQWRFIENFSVTPAGGKYRPTSHEYKISITNVIGQAIDIGEMQALPVQGKETKKLELTLTDTDDHQIACCLWGHFAEHLLYAYKVGEVNQNFLCLLRFAKINVYKGQVQITNSFETSTLEINPPGFDVQDYQRLMPNNELALTTGTGEVVKPKGNKRQPDKWYVYPDRTVLDIIMATEIEKCIVKGTVYAIDTDWAWYYFGCVKCHFKKVTNITKKDIVPVKHLWFKLHLLIKDDTGETKVMLLDTIAEPIVGVSVEVLLDGSIEETFKFGVYVSKDNVDYGSHIFNIGKTWSADEIISESDDENIEDTLTNVVSSDRPSG
ncbi:uncharacterized protein LOC106373653 [Brassica napus]|uniref:uncharacterized protein LOC106373653 n=1 Tax=Brassica napus TaxID=3708 RepID=UPI0006AB68DD|nr:uncharacterized protein LOC106373653 [Brassica napus]